MNTAPANKEKGRRDSMEGEWNTELTSPKKKDNSKELNQIDEEEENNELALT
jgi:hypothetical protein